MSPDDPREPAHAPPEGGEADVRRLLAVLVKLALTGEASETAAWRSQARGIAANSAAVDPARLDTLWAAAVKAAEADPVVRRDETVNPMLPTRSPLGPEDVRTEGFDLDRTIQSIRDASSFG